MASALMATARSFGNYDLAAALADLIDNSIKAEAEKIYIEFVPEDDDVIVRIRDDGTGMSREELIAAMRPASTHPEEIRTKFDLGRFGWGMKSASLSQARVAGNKTAMQSFDTDRILDMIRRDVSVALEIARYQLPYMNPFVSEVVIEELRQHDDPNVRDALNVEDDIEED